ncbi:MAG: COX15/CtaA family protein [Gallionellaceae bacterium]|nr:COX15/CtaA family protein [Gallionellaceae bacterium]
MKDHHRTFHILVLLTFVLMVAVVLLSAYMRLSAAGLSCTEWPGCYGQILSGNAPPRPAWINITHRIAASIMGLAALGIVALGWKIRQTSRSRFLQALALFGLTLFLAALGRWTHDARLPAVALGNLLGGLGMLLLLWNMHLGCMQQSAVASGLKGWIGFGLLLLFAQVMLGGMASANFSASSCAGLTATGCEKWVQGATWAAFNPFNPLEVPAGSDFAPGVLQQTLHMAHRAMILPLFCYLVWLGIRLFRANHKGGGALLIATLVLQIVLGISIVVNGSPLFLVMLHNAMAAFMLLVLVTLLAE